MMLTYILRWAQIFVSNRVVYAILRDYAPIRVFTLLIWIALRRAERRLSCRFPVVEQAVARLSPRPLLMIHGDKDAYIGTEIARQLFDEAGEPKELWIVPGAKHNRCREVDAETYAERIQSFLRRYAPRSLGHVDAGAEGDSLASPPVAPAPAPGEVTLVHSPPIEREPVPEPAPTHPGGLAVSVSG
jgi:hypothetical protein